MARIRTNGQRVISTPKAKLGNMKAKLNQAKSLADILAGSFETRERQSGGTFHALKDNAPEWVSDAVRAAHGERLPCDWIYQQCDSIASDIRQAIVHDDREPEDIADYIEIEPDIYTANVTAWLADHLDNLNYCNQYATEFGFDNSNEAPTDQVTSLISGGQYLAKREIADVMIAAFVAQWEEQE